MAKSICHPTFFELVQPATAGPRTKTNWKGEMSDGITPSTRAEFATRLCLRLATRIGLSTSTLRSTRSNEFKMGSSPLPKKNDDLLQTAAVLLRLFLFARVALLMHS
jgi:hypothetical protein